MRIDAHQHFWKLDGKRNDWPTPDLTAIYRDFLPEDLEAHLQAHHIDKTILVQAAPLLAETEFLLDLATRYDFIGGVVGWLDMSSPQFPEQFATLAKHPKFIGIRPMLQGLADERWILRPEVKDNIRILVENDFPIDLLIFPKHLPVIAELLKGFPTLRAVIDHCAKPDIKQQQWEPWAEAIAEVAAFPSVMCKISGLVTEADHQKWQVSDFTPYIDHLLQKFGTTRIMFGSDWPVCLLAASYDQVVGIVESNILDKMSGEDKQQLFGGNAQKFYLGNK